MNKTYTILFLCFLLYGCGAVNPHQIKMMSSAEVDYSGFLVLSVNDKNSFFGTTRTTSYNIKSKDNSIDFVVSDRSKTAERSVSFSNMLFIDFFELPVGEYEIYSWESYCFNGFASWQEKSKVPFSIPFTIEGGKINYIGQISLAEDYSIIFTNKSSRDIAAFYKKYSNLKELEIIDHKMNANIESASPEKSGKAYLTISPTP